MRRQRLALTALGLLWGGYLLQLASPLRMNTDATYFLDLAANASDGGGFLVDGKPTHFPVGYPLIVAAIDRAGLACSASFIGLNLVALAAGLAANAYVLRRSFRLGTGPILATALLTLLCWVYIKHVTLPLSDLPYFGLAQCCIALLTWGSDRPWRSRLPAVVLAVPLVTAAIAVRTVGIALLPAVVFACLPAGSVGQALEVLSRRRGRVALAAVGLVGGVVLAGLLVARTQYFQEFLDRWRDRAIVGELASYKLSDWGELVVNTSAAKLPGAARGVVVVAGAVVPLLLAWGAWSRDRLAAVDVYAASYVAILLVWPYQDARFWIPMVPIFLGYIGLAWERHATVAAVRWAGAAYLAAYSLLGVVALGYSTWLSMAPDRFAERYGGGVYRDSYRAALEPGAAAGERAMRVDPQIVRLVRRYARPTH